LDGAWARQIGSGAIVAGGTTVGAAPTQTLTYGSAGGLGGLQGASGASSILTTGPITAGTKVSGWLAFTPTVSSGNATAIDVNLANVSAGASLSDFASNVQTAVNAQAGAADYTVTVVGGDRLQVGLTNHAVTTDHITGLGSVTGTGFGAHQTGFTLGVTGGSSPLGGTLTVTPLTTVAGGTPAAVSFSGGGTGTLTTNVTSGNLLTSSSLTLEGDIPASGGVASELDWIFNGATGSADITAGNTLSGGFTITQDGNGGSPLDISLDDVNPDMSNLVSSIQSQIASDGGTASDWTIGYSGGGSSITLNANDPDHLVGADITNDASAATQTTPEVDESFVYQSLNLNDVTTANLQSTLNTELAGSDFNANYDSGTGALSFGISTAGQDAGVTNIVGALGSLSQATPAVTGTGTPVAIDLDGVTTANLASTVQTALNGSNTTNPDYSVLYSNGTLTVGLTAQAATDHITGFGLSGTLTQGRSAPATLAVSDGDTLGGQFTITPTINGSAANAINVGLAGVTTANLVSTVNAALGSAASDYTVGYNVQSGVGTLSIAVNATGTAAGVSSVSIANGSGNSALSEGTVTESGINSANTLGNFTVTPTGAGSAANVDLDGATSANLQSKVQTALGNDYLAAYNATSGTLSIGVSSTGAAAGITLFTVAEARQAAASEETPVSGGVNIYTSDGTSTGSQNYNVTVGTLSASGVGTSSSTSNMGGNITATVGGVTGTGGVQSGAGAGTSLTGTSVGTQADAEAALETVDDAINAVAYQRGQVGANINTLTAASSIASAQMTNITSAQNTITATDYAAATSNMSKYEILTQTGISALAQANSTQQMVTKLLQ
jgi:flagellin